MNYRGKSIPLHDHPHMTVLSKLVSGSLAARAFSLDKLDSKSNTHSLTLDARKTDKDSAWFLTPSINNIHEFHAENTCVIFDILLPPYDEGEGRPCNYYSAVSQGEVWRLLPAEEPKELPYGVRYPGFRPVEKTVHM